MPFHDIGENQNVVAPIEEQYARQGKIFEIFLFLE
jgi:hypothetical protein